MALIPTFEDNLIADPIILGNSQVYAPNEGMGSDGAGLDISEDRGDDDVVFGDGLHSARVKRLPGG